MFSSSLAICLATKISCVGFKELPQPLSYQPTTIAVQAFTQKGQMEECKTSGTLKILARIKTSAQSICSDANSTPHRNLSHSSVPIASLQSPIPPESPPHTSAEFLLAAPQNLNPGLAPPPIPPPIPPPEVRPVKPPDSSGEGTSTAQPLSIKLESVDLNFRSDSSNVGQLNRTIEPTFNFNINDEFSVAVTTGFNFFRQSGIRSVTNLPVRLNWQGEIGDFRVTAGGGVDLFDRLPPQPNFNVSAAIPVFSTVTLTPTIEYGAYKPNAKTIENQINALRFGANLYWQIDSHTSLSSLLRLGVYNDGNFEQQSFSRLEHRIGNFAVALNLFSLVYKNDLSLQSGYFSPHDFLVYNGEISWQDSIFDFLNCRVIASFGNQRLQGIWATAYTLQGLCAVQITPDISFNLGYSLNNKTTTGGVNIKF